MTDQPQDPQALLAQLAHCLATPTVSTVGDYIDAKQQLDDYCDANGLSWQFDDDGDPYIERAKRMAGNPARRIIEGIVGEASQMPQMTPVRPAIEGSNGTFQAYLTVGNAPCGHALVVWANNDDWHNGTAYCQMPDCGAGYVLVFDTSENYPDEGGKLIGVEPSSIK